MVDWKSSDIPFLGGPDTLEAKVVVHPFSFAGSGDRELNALVVEAVNRMGGSGEHAEDRYQRAPAPLWERAGEVVDVVFAEYEAQPEESHLDRCI